MSEQYKKYEPIFGFWHINKLIGEGSFGKVFQIEREDFGTKYEAALKAITIPQSQSEIKSLRADGMDENSITTYLEQFVTDVVNEFVLMSKLKGNSNVVSYEDHAIMKHEEGIGWDILIRMELLTNLIDNINNSNLTRKDVIKLGIDICKALELCQKYNIIHRDIKPENIFISSNGDYKLGDFGIARQIEKTTSGLSKKGTYTYMAPEVYKGAEYGSTVDIYSLGIVMYRLLNENRTPFLPAYPSPITHTDREKSLIQRMSGEKIEPPKNCDGRLLEIVLKACEFNPKDRYSSPMQMREELEAIVYSENEGKIIYPKGDDVSIKSVEYILTDSDNKKIEVTNDEKTESLFKEEEVTQEQPVIEEIIENNIVPEQENIVEQHNIDEDSLDDAQSPDTNDVIKIPIWKNKLIVASAIGIISLVLVVFGAISILNNKPTYIPVISIEGVNEEITFHVGESVELQMPIVEPDNATDKDITYKIEDETVATIDQQRKITALQIGTTTLIVMTKDYTKKITISVVEVPPEDWRIEGYDDEGKEYELLWVNGQVTEQKRYTGNTKPDEPQPQTPVVQTPKATPKSATPKPQQPVSTPKPQTQQPVKQAPVQQPTQQAPAPQTPSAPKVDVAPKVDLN